MYIHSYLQSLNLKCTCKLATAIRLNRKSNLQAMIVFQTRCLGPGPCKLKPGGLKGGLEESFRELEAGGVGF